MSFCPKCRTEYIEGTTNCEDCGVALVAELPPPVALGDGDGNLIEVWSAQGEMDAQMVRSMLESNGIASMLKGEALRLTHGFTVDGLAEVQILVREADAKRACNVIASFKDMKQCTLCGYPMHDEDVSCRSCGRSPSD